MRVNGQCLSSDDSSVGKGLLMGIDLGSTFFKVGVFDDALREAGRGRAPVDPR